MSEINPEMNYGKAIERYAEQLSIASEVASNPFKAPEQVVETTRPLLEAIWDVQVEYAAMIRSNAHKHTGPSK